MPCIRDMARNGLRALKVLIVLKAWIPPAPRSEAIKLISDTYLTIVKPKIFRIVFFFLKSIIFFFCVFLSQILLIYSMSDSPSFFWKGILNYFYNKKNVFRQSPDSVCWKKLSFKKKIKQKNIHLRDSLKYENIKLKLKTNKIMKTK